MPNRFQLVCPSHAAIFTCHTSRPGSFAVSHGLFCLYRHSFDTVRRGHVLKLFFALHLAQDSDDFQSVASYFSMEDSEEIARF